MFSYKTIITYIVTIIPTIGYALTFNISPHSDMVGDVTETRVETNETIADVGRRSGIGIYELIEANPNINPKKLWAGSKLVVPSQFILPHIREGIVINLAELRIYYFHPNKKTVSTYPIGIGRRDWETPIGQGKITKKTKNPSWIPPTSIRDWYKERNMPLPDVIPPGPKNPLGDYAMRLSIPGYLIHGTNRPSGIGLRTSSGCIRLYPEDIEQLFNFVSINTPVHIINRPFKFGKHNGILFMEAHEPLTGEVYEQMDTQQMLEDALTTFNLDYEEMNLKAIGNIVREAHGIPVKVE